MSELTLAGLRVVLEVARTGAFSAAAERLEYTQSAVSRQVAVTEKAAGAPLFERHARGVRLTAAGEVLVRHAGKVLNGVAAASQELAGLRDRLAGPPRVRGFPPGTGAPLPRPPARLPTGPPALPGHGHRRPSRAARRPLDPRPRPGRRTAPPGLRGHNPRRQPRRPGDGPRPGRRGHAESLERRCALS